MGAESDAKRRSVIRKFYKAAAHARQLLPKGRAEDKRLPKWSGFGTKMGAPVVYH